MVARVNGVAPVNLAGCLLVRTSVNNDLVAVVIEEKLKPTNQ